MATQQTYARASDYIHGLGDSLDTVADKDMLLHEYEIERERAFGDGTSTLVTIKLSTIDDPATVVTFHAWSDAIADRLDEMTGNDVKLPVIVMFTKVKTRRGFNVWTIR